MHFLPYLSFLPSNRLVYETQVGRVCRYERSSEDILQSSSQCGEGFVLLQVPELVPFVAPYPPYPPFLPQGIVPYLWGWFYNTPTPPHPQEGAVTLFGKGNKTTPTLPYRTRRLTG